MKKFVSMLAAALIMTLCFAGCGNDKNNGNNVVDDAATAVSDAASDVIGGAETIASDIVDDGTVTDGDGIIGNENKESTANNNSATEGSTTNTEASDGLM